MLIGVLNGVNLNVLDRRDPDLYGGLSLPRLEERIRTWGLELGLEVVCRQTNSEGEYVVDRIAVVARSSRYISRTSRAVRTGAGIRCSQTSRRIAWSARGRTATRRRWNSWHAGRAAARDDR